MIFYYYFIYFLAAIGIIILIALVALLLIPLHVSLQLLKRGSITSGNLRVSWLGLTFHRKIPSGEKKKTQKKEEEKEKKRPNLSRLPENVSRLLESLPYLPDIAQTFMRSLTIERFSADVELGLGSPVETAVVSGYLWSLASVVNVSPKADFSVRPNFQEEQIEGSLITDLKIRLLWIVVALVKAGTKKPVRQLFTSMRRTRGG